MIIFANVIGGILVILGRIARGGHLHDDNGLRGKYRQGRGETKVGLGEPHQAIPLLGTFINILPTVLKIFDFFRMIYRGRVLIVVRPLGHRIRFFHYSALVGVVVDPVDNIYAKIALVIGRAKPSVIIAIYASQLVINFFESVIIIVPFPVKNLLKVMRAL
jgi:hypothetical protein